MKVYQLLGFAVISFCSIYCASSDDGLRFASFNIQVLGQTKMRKPEVVKVLVKTLLDFDITHIQEIRDSKQTAIYKLLEEVNKKHKERKQPGEYAIVVGERLGRTSSKEQYAYFYRKDLVKLVDVYQYPDKNDDFERQPFCAKFQSRKLKVEEFIVIGIHITPQDVAGEIDKLLDVYEDVKIKLNSENVIITGNFNAGCSYLNVGERKKSKFMHDSRFHWLLDDTSDTTVATSACPYDRLVITGTDLISAVDPRTVGVYHFDKIFHLTPEEAKKVSDHYPVYLSIAYKPDPLNAADFTNMRSMGENENLPSLLNGNAKDVAKSLGYTIQEEFTSPSKKTVKMMKAFKGKKEILGGLYFALDRLSDIVSVKQIDGVLKDMVNREGIFISKKHSAFHNIYYVMIECTVVSGRDRNTLGNNCELKFKMKYQ